MQWRKYRCVCVCMVVCVSGCMLVYMCMCVRILCAYLCVCVLCVCSSVYVCECLYTCVDVVRAPCHLTIENHSLI